jgi:hypothetical protein
MTRPAGLDDDPGETPPPKDPVIEQIYRAESCRPLIPQQPYVDLWREVFGIGADGPRAVAALVLPGVAGPGGRAVPGDHG